MMLASAYGRLGQDPKKINTQSGNAMAVTSIAVNIGDHDTPPQWMGIVAFGKVAEDLLKHHKGDMVSASGRVQRSNWTGQNGEKKEQLQIVADSLVSSRLARPGGSRKPSDSGRRRDDLNDEIPFGGRP
jgi:single-strand DNA-binding protein